jgi:hypothetical protein
MSVLTKHGEQILSEIISIHREEFAEVEGISENDIERDFLLRVLNSGCNPTAECRLRLTELIETIR